MSFYTNIYISTNSKLSADDNKYWRFILEENKVGIQKYNPLTKNFDPHVPKDTSNKTLTITQGIFCSSAEFEYYYLDWSINDKLFGVSESNECRVFNFETAGWEETKDYTPPAAWQKDIVKIKISVDDDLMKSCKDYVVQMIDKQEEADKKLYRAQAEIEYIQNKAAEAARYPEKIEESVQKAFGMLTASYRKVEKIYKVLCIPENKDLNDFQHQLEHNYLRERYYETFSVLPINKILRLPNSPGFNKKEEEQKILQRFAQKEIELINETRSNLMQAFEKAVEQQRASQQTETPEVSQQTEPQKTLQQAHQQETSQQAKQQTALKEDIQPYQKSKEQSFIPAKQELHQAQNISESSTPKPELTQKQKKLKNPVSLLILGGFITAIGIIAVALAFVLLNAITFGTAGLVVASLGAAAILGGIGLFAKGLNENRETNNHDISLEASNPLTV